MEQRDWAHPCDQTGKRRDHDAVPARLGALLDDRYRSLAGFLREAGGCAKDTSPFAEFMGADCLRLHIGEVQIATSFDAALRDAMGLAKSPLARYLPGGSGPTEKSR